ncbi:MAG: argininosuccinate lyase [Smithellaceae bacterium]|nr:argininosuccinate lyase [Smithellaceae bacterium]
MKEKAWGGRFALPTDSEVEAFTASVHFDKRLYKHDILGSIAHARMLARRKIISAKERDAICAGLKEIGADIEGGAFTFRADDEDIHMAIERALTEIIGAAGGKLHTGRSRNDQVALDVRLYLRDEIADVLKLLARLKKMLLKTAKKEIETILPGYTHMQKAQPVLLAHYLLAYYEMFSRDQGRFEDCRRRVNVMPLGAAALAGTGLPIDRKAVAKELKFPALSENSMDAVSDRDFAAEFIFAAATVMMHLSRFCEDLIIWSTDEFSYVEISDAFTTGSSIMPQKKNPDVAELIRGKTSRVYGDLVALLTLLKGLPMTYNRDLQEDKEPLFDAVDTVKSSLSVFAAMVGHVKFDRRRMRAGAEGGFSTATDAAEYLVSKGVPFREAHRVVGTLVAYCLEKNKPLTALSLEELRRFHKKFDADILGRLAVESSVAARKSYGGTATEVVAKRIAELEKNAGR